MPPAGAERPFWRSLGLAVLIESALLAGLVLWAPEASLPPAARRAPVTQVELEPPPAPVVQAPPKEPPKPAPVRHAPARRPVPRPRPQVTHKPIHVPTAAPPLPTPALSVPPAPPVVVPPAVAAPAAVPTAARIAAIRRYAAALRTLIQEQVHVPQTVRALRLRGRALIAFQLAPDGHLLWARLARSSGLGPIDQAALTEVQVRQYPRFSAKMPRHPLNFTVVLEMNAARQ